MLLIVNQYISKEQT